MCIVQTCILIMRIIGNGVWVLVSRFRVYFLSFITCLMTIELWYDICNKCYHSILNISWIFMCKIHNLIIVILSSAHYFQYQWFTLSVSFLGQTNFSNTFFCLDLFSPYFTRCHSSAWLVHTYRPIMNFQTI